MLRCPIASMLTAAHAQLSYRVHGCGSCFDLLERLPPLSAFGYHASSALQTSALQQCSPEDEIFRKRKKKNEADPTHCEIDVMQTILRVTGYPALFEVRQRVTRWTNMSVQDKLLCVWREHVHYNSSKTTVTTIVWRRWDDFYSCRLTWAYDTPIIVWFYIGTKSLIEIMYTSLMPVPHSSFRTSHSTSVRALMCTGQYPFGYSF